MPRIFNFKVIIEQDEKGYFVASAPAIPGCYTQGASYEEVIKNIKEAIQLCLEEAKKDLSYKEKINWDDTGTEKNRFLGITDVPIRFAFQ